MLSGTAQKNEAVANGTSFNLETGPLTLILPIYHSPTSWSLSITVTNTSTFRTHIHWYRNPCLRNNQARTTCLSPTRSRIKLRRRTRWLNAELHLPTRSRQTYIFWDLVSSVTISWMPLSDLKRVTE